MNNLLARLLQFLTATVVTALTVIIFGLIARAYWMLFMLGWGVL